MLSYLTMLKILISLSMATTYFSPEPDDLLRAQYCFLKSEIPPELKITPFHDEKENKYNFQVLNTSNQNVIIYDDENKNDRFKVPENLDPHHLPVAYLKKKELFKNSYKSGFRVDKYDLNPLGERLWGESIVFTNIDFYKEYINITDKIKNSFFEIPFKYYYKDKFEENRIFIYTKKVVDQYKKEKLQINDVKFLKPLPDGVTVKVIKNVITADLDGYYSSLAFENINEEPMVFVKEFKMPIDNFTLVKQGIYPFYIGNSKNCLRFNLDNKEKISEVERKEFLEEFTRNHAGLIDLILLKIRNEKILQSIKDEKINTVIPFGYVFKGPSMLKDECTLELYHLDHSTTDRLIKSDVIPLQIIIPDDEITNMNLLLNQKKLKMKVIKRYVKNPDWIPLKMKGDTWGSCSTNCEEVEKMKKKEIKIKNLLKEVTVIKSSSPYRDEDLICVTKKE